MNGIHLENNLAEVVGTVVSELFYSHEVYGETFWCFKLAVPRLSAEVDTLVITVSERLTAGVSLDVGDKIFVKGQFRSYNNLSNEGNRLLLTIFAKSIEDAEENDAITPNYIYLNGYICKPPIFRTTPFGREISDILLAVNRSYNKSDYIPCITWGRNAKFASTFNVGDNIKIWGRIQSREYQKKIDEDNVLTKIAYEVSVSKLECSAQEGSHETELG